MKQVISFSLYGDHPKYNAGLIKNIELAEKIYPDWTCFIYYNDTTPQRTIEEIRKSKQIELYDMTGCRLPGMLWRFLPYDHVERFIVRDADSRLTMREKSAVEEWIKSRKILHIMRDHPHHKDAILGGMWGMMPGEDFNMLHEMEQYVDCHDLYARQVDMDFLRDVVYKRYKYDSVIHASFHCREPWARSFPVDMKDDEFVGEIYDENDRRESHYLIFKRHRFILKYPRLIRRIYSSFLSVALNCFWRFQKIYRYKHS